MTNFLHPHMTLPLGMVHVDSTHKNHLVYISAYRYKSFATSILVPDIVYHEVGYLNMMLTLLHNKG